jgi:hypothetical protein
MLAVFGAFDHRPQGDSRLTRILVAGVALLFQAAAAEAATAVPHRAVYDLALTRAGSGSSLASAEGRLAFELQGSTCEGWTVSFRMATRSVPAEGESNLIDTQTTSFESGDALSFRHQVRELVNGETKEERRVKFDRPKTDAEANGEIEAKENSAFTIPANAWLPMQHQMKLMALGEAGGGRDASIIFDGSDGEKTFNAISFVGKAKPAGSIARDRDNPVAMPLGKLAAWPMTISYFPETGGEEIPDYQVSFDMYENGVATGLLLDYGSFALSGTLTSLDMLEAEACPSP